MKYDILPSAVYNKVHWHNYVSGDFWPGEKFSPGVSSIPDPGGLIIKYGYQRWYQDRDNMATPASQFRVLQPRRGHRQVKGPATVKAAFITWKKAANSPQACASNIWCLDAPMAVGDGATCSGRRSPPSPST